MHRRLLAIFIPGFDQPALRAIRVLRPLKLVTGFESKSAGCRDLEPLDFSLEEMSPWQWPGNPVAPHTVCYHSVLCAQSFVFGLLPRRNLTDIVVLQDADLRHKNWVSMVNFSWGSVHIGHMCPVWICILWNVVSWCEFKILCCLILSVKCLSSYLHSFRL